jgi:hypothetical protein
MSVKPQFSLAADQYVGVAAAPAREPAQALGAAKASPSDEKS